MTTEEHFTDVVSVAEHTTDDQRIFAGNAVQYAKDRNFKMFNEVIDRAIDMAGCLPRDLRDLKRFVTEHPELDRGGF